MTAADAADGSGCDSSSDGVLVTSAWLQRTPSSSAATVPVGDLWRTRGGLRRLWTSPLTWREICHAPRVRIGTWNLAGRWSTDHLDFVLRLDCDVLLLTEVSERLTVPDHHLHLGEQPMMPKRRWAALLSREPITPLPDPHPASALGRIGTSAYCSSVLPWRSCGTRQPWSDGSHADRTARTVERLRTNLPSTNLIWGGDWNHALECREYAGSQGGRQHIAELVADLDLQVPTSQLPHRIDGLLSIDHLAVPDSAAVSEARRVSALTGGGQLSDHDAYVVVADL